MRRALLAIVCGLLFVGGLATPARAATTVVVIDHVVAVNQSCLLPGVLTCPVAQQFRGVGVTTSNNERWTIQFTMAPIACNPFSPCSGPFRVASDTNPGDALSGTVSSQGFWTVEQTTGRFAGLREAPSMISYRQNMCGLELVWCSALGINAIQTGIQLPLGAGSLRFELEPA